MLISMIFLGMATGIVGAVVTGIATGSFLVGVAFYMGAGLVATSLGACLEFMRSAPEGDAPGGPNPVLPAE